MAQRLVEPADDEQDERGSADGCNAAEDEMLRPGKEDIARIDDATHTGELDVIVREDNLICVGREKCCPDADEQESDEDSPECERIGQQVGLPVHHHQADEEEAENGDGRGCNKSWQICCGKGSAKIMVTADLRQKIADADRKPDADHEFDQRIPD